MAKKLTKKVKKRKTVKRKPGRPTLCTDEIADKLLEGIREGQSIEGAAVRAGISLRTYYEWKERGESGEEPFSQFLHSLRQAEAEIEYETAGHWRNHTSEDWRAAREFLERRFPHRWGEKKAIEHQGPGSEPVEITVRYVDASNGEPSEKT